ncbi:UPF0488 protein C8orf33 homolog [Denticeps clupeoides]|uniref:Zgc:112185 n=1 Tax=Denticeps clupeoides TaxID=299321 RepID=A0AAY4AE85_9TELE|nr:UPF0488 protein C8orf33 homolog [Denticeps clupeoides]
MTTEEKTPAKAGFRWTCSDNSLPETEHPPEHNAPLAVENPPEQGAGFAFNFVIPVVPTGNEGGETPALSNSKGVDLIVDPPPSSKAKKKKKKKKKVEAGGGVAQHEVEAKTATVPETSDLTPEQQLSRELDWCIEQLELGLRTQKTTPKQKEEAAQALRTLRSSKAPLVKKRQVMRAVAGDYRTKMEQEREKQFKNIKSAMGSARVHAISQPTRKAVFHRRAEPKVPHTEPARSQATQGAEVKAEPRTFVFCPSHEEFRFNFL